jgi:hypothetical protein
MQNSGLFHRKGNSEAQGFEWPKGTGITEIYDSGLTLIAKSGTTTKGSVADNGVEEYYPGYIDFQTHTPHGKNDTLFRIYKVNPQYVTGGNGFDSWSLWPVSQGAPWIDNNNNGIYEPPIDKPLMKGDENTFCSYTDGYPESHISSHGSTLPINAEIHLYCYAKTNIACADAVYMEWKIINKNISAWDSLKAAVWSDPDLGSPSGNRTGCDTLLGLGFTYCSRDTDNVLGIHPPALGFALYNNTGHPTRQMDFFNPPNKSNEGARNFEESKNLMNGLYRDGSPKINPVTNRVTKFIYSGDPETGTGWNRPFSDDIRYYMGSYFTNVNPLDTINFNCAFFIKRGTSNLNSVTQLKNCVNQIVGIRPEENLTGVPLRYSLSQNYPNPFNPVTRISYEIPTAGEVRLVVYDVLGKEAAVLVNERMNAGSYSAEFNGSALSSGVYFYKLSVGEFSQVRKMVLVK